MTKPILQQRRDALTRFEMVRDGCRPPAPPPEPSPDVSKSLARLNALFARINAALEQEQPAHQETTDHDNP